MSTAQESQVTIRLTPAALGKVREFIAAEQDMPRDTLGLRIGVMPGGCSGFKYEMSIDESPAEDDIIVEIEGVRLFVDPFSAPYLQGVGVDYISTMQSQGFAFENPNASGGCGCGTSFSV
jgi:iron-sulfur cluster assembly accessory protein